MSEAKSKIVYCTYFDRGFLLKGLALHASLTRYRPNAKLWILVFDKYTEDILKKMELQGVTVVSLEEFEDKDLLAVKGTRNPVEYYWTCTPSLPLYIFKKNRNIDYVVYLDADLYFYSDVALGVKEIKKDSILAVEHRFPPGREHLVKDSGRFNVAFNVFKNDDVGVKCLKRWRKQCLNWCYWRHEDDKLGDQMYLDEWPRLYGNELAISNNLGVDAAPWNISQYKVSKKGKLVYINNDRLICYHFHQFQILGHSNFSRVLGYTLSKDVVKYIYEPYERELKKGFRFIKKFDPGFEIKPPKNSENGTKILRQKMAKYLGPLYWKFKSVFYCSDNI